jgi:hypothetical protein
MKLDVTTVDGTRGWSDRIAAVLVAAGLALAACGIVAGALWSVWRLAEVVP